MSHVHTENTIWIQAPPQRVFDLAADVAKWPDLLPHYRWVKVLRNGDSERIVAMAAHRSGIPVNWTSIQRLQPEEGRVLYTHIAGITTGMAVEWRLEPRDGGTRVTIRHDLSPRSWLLRSKLAAWIIGDLFVKAVAARTLRYIKLAAEKGVGQA